MKQHAKWFATALSVASGLIIASSTQAQTLTTLSDFHNFTLSATFAQWDPVQSQIINGGNGYTPTLTSGPLNFEVNAEGYGSGAFNFPTAFDVPSATEVQLTFTVNSTTTPSTDFLGPNFDLSDGTHQVQYLAYNHYTGPGTYTVIAPLGSIDPTDVTAFNIEFDPAGFGGGSPYDITYDNISLVTVPEPATLALFGIGAATFVAARRRSKLS